MKLKHTIAALGAGLGALLAGTPAKAITYYFTGSDTYNCDFGANLCTINYNDLAVDLTAGTWGANPLSGNIQVTNGSTATVVFGPTSTVAGNASAISFTDSFSNSIGFVFSQPLTETASQGAQIQSISSTSFTSTFSSLRLNGDPAVAGNGLALAVPFLPSAFALLPISAVARRKKLRTLSV